jgi:hypothetical protein
MEIIRKGSLIENKGSSVVHLDALHPQSALNHGIVTDLPMLVMAGSEKADSSAGFVAVLSPERIVERFKASCIEAHFSDTNPSFINSKGKPREARSGNLVRRLTT